MLKRNNYAKKKYTELNKKMLKPNKVVNNMLGGMPKTDKTSKNKSMRQWISENKDEIDAAIQRVAPGAPKNNRERELWVQNDEGLYTAWKQDMDLSML